MKAPVSWCAAAIVALLLLELAGQYYRLMPEWSYGGEPPVNSDSLVFPTLAMELSTGQATHGQWMSNPAPFWATVYPFIMASMALSGNDWRLSLALYAAVSALCVVLALTVVIRQATGATWAGSILSAGTAVALLAIVISFSGAESGKFSAGSRPANAALFFLVAAGMARVCAAPRPSGSPALYAYLLLCLVLGASDALILFHVALPVFLVACHRRFAMGEGGLAVLVASALGCVLVLAGHRLQESVSPFVPNPAIYNLSPYMTEIIEDIATSIMDGWYGIAVEPVSKHAHRISGLLGPFLFGGNLPNLLMLACSLFLVRWAGAPAAGGPRHGGTGGGLQAVTRSVLAQLVLALILSTLLMSVLVRFVQGYMHLMLWASFLSLAVVLPATAGPALKRVVGVTSIALVSATLVASLAFLRTDAADPPRVGCSADTVWQAGLRRGLVPYWHSNMVAVAPEREVADLVYIARTEQLPLSLYQHVGNVGRLQGNADYVVAENAKPWLIERFRGIYGLPSRVARCKGESYLLYGAGIVAGDAI